MCDNGRCNQGKNGGLQHDHDTFPAADLAHRIFPIASGIAHWVMPDASFRSQMD
jgi:hypothetical protein